MQDSCTYGMQDSCTYGMQGSCTYGSMRAWQGNCVLFFCCSELQKALEERTGRLAELEQEVEVMRGELSAAHEATKQAPSKTLRALVDKLRDQLAIKEKQHQVLYYMEKKTLRIECIRVCNTLYGVCNTL